MTENEAIERMRYRIDTATDIAGKGTDGKAFEDMEIAIKALEEIQQYRAIGTVEECREARERQIPKKPVKYGDTRQGLDNDGNSISWQEDCYECPTCGSFIGYASDCKDEHYQDDFCRNCGQAISWESDTP